MQYAYVREIDMNLKQSSKQAEQVLKDIGRSVPDGCMAVMGEDKIFFLHPFKRYDPITLAAVGIAAGTGIGIAGTLEEGKQAEKIAKQRAAVDLANAEAVDKAGEEKARIKKEKGRRFIETQKSEAIAGNIRVNVGSPLVIETQTRSDIAKDIGFSLKTTRTESDFFRSRAAIEIATGKVAKRKSRLDALSQGLLGLGSLAFMGSQAGLFSRSQTGTAATSVSSAAKPGLTPVQSRIFSF